MPTFPFMQVDAFTTVPLGGNPCAIVFDADSLDDAARQAIAREMNLSETSFVITPAAADFGARYFTPAEEIPLAGHPTIATIFALVESGRLQLTGDYTTITLDLKVGPIPIEIYASGGQVQRVVMSQKRPQFLTTYDPAAVMPAVFTAWSSWSMPAAIRSTKWRPASVNRTPRAWRSNRRMPRSSSSAFTRALTLDCATPSALAAWRKFRYSATARV